MIQACQCVEARGTGCQRFVQLGVLDSDAGLISQAPRQPAGLLVKAMTALAEDMQHSENVRTYLDRDTHNSTSVILLGRAPMLGEQRGGGQILYNNFLTTGGNMST